MHIQTVRWYGRDSWSVKEVVPCASNRLPVARDRIDGYGEMAERFKAAVSKTVVGASSTVGSNPTLSAIRRTRNAPDQPLLRPARLSQRGEVPEWPNGHDWKSCRGRKSLAGSNPALSASV